VLAQAVTDARGEGDDAVAAFPCKRRVRGLLKPENGIVDGRVSADAFANVTCDNGVVVRVHPRRPRARS
jgi:hypothetical protein